MQDDDNDNVVAEVAKEAAKQAARQAKQAAKEAAIRNAEGEAQAILTVQEAIAQGVRLVNEANPGEGVIALKSLEALEKLANGTATKIVVPSDIQSMAGLATTAKELLSK